jgi:hypothetical protein
VSRLSYSPSNPSIRPRIWSWEALRQAQLWVPVRADDPRLEDRTRIGSIALPHYSPERGSGFIAPQAPRRRDLGEWLFGIAASFDTCHELHPHHACKIGRVFQSFIDFDAARRDWRVAAEAAANNGQLGLQAAHARREAQQRRTAASRRLELFLRAGLERREGARLHGEEKTWIHLAARGFSHPALRVCEQCAVVFRAPRAQRCPDCRRSPIRIHLYPLELGGWHVDYRVGGRWATERLDRTVHYIAACQSCEARFETTRPNRKYCGNCSGGSGRVRRHRGGSRTGRQRFRFAHEEGADAWSVSFNTLDGQTVLLEAVDGIIETDDAEIAKLVRTASGTRPID